MLVPAFLNQPYFFASLVDNILPDMILANLVGDPVPIGIVDPEPHIPIIMAVCPVATQIFAVLETLLYQIQNLPEEFRPVAGNPAVP